MQILLVEAESVSSSLIADVLKNDLHAVTTTSDIYDAFKIVTRGETSLVVVDLDLHLRRGFVLIASLRSAQQLVPILAVANRDKIDDCLESILIGAQDYVLKPVAAAELLARMHVLSFTQQAAPKPVVRTDRLVLDANNQTALVGSQTHWLTAREFSVLEVLLAHRGHVVSRFELEQDIYGPEGLLRSNVIEYIIHGLRKKLGRALIRNVRGHGWIIDDLRPDHLPA